MRARPLRCQAGTGGAGDVTVGTEGQSCRCIDRLVANLQDGEVMSVEVALGTSIGGPVMGGGA